MFRGNKYLSEQFRKINMTDSEKALDDAGLLNENNLRNVMQHDDCLANGLCWLRNERLLTQEALDKLLHSVKPGLFAEVFCRLAQNSALTHETYLKFSAIGNDAHHLELVYENLTILMSRFHTEADRKKLLYLINQLADPQTAKEVFYILYGLDIHFKKHKSREFPSVALDLLTQPENKVTWSGIAEVIREIQYGSSTSEEIQKLANAEIDRTANLTGGNALLKEQRAQTIEGFFNLFSPNSSMAKPKTELSTINFKSVPTRKDGRTLSISLEVGNSEKLKQIEVSFDFDSAEKVKLFKFDIFPNEKFNSGLMSAISSDEDLAGINRSAGSDRVSIEAKNLADACKVIQFISTLERCDKESIDKIYEYVDAALTPPELLDQGLTCTNSADALRIARGFINSEKALLRKDNKLWSILYLLGESYEKKGLKKDAINVYECLTSNCKFTFFVKLAHYRLAKMIVDAPETNDENQQVLNTGKVFYHLIRSGSNALKDIDTDYIEAVLNKLYESDVGVMARDLKNCNDPELGAHIANILENMGLYKEAIDLYRTSANQRWQGIYDESVDAVAKASYEAARILMRYPESDTDADERARRLEGYEFCVNAAIPGIKYLIMHFEEECSKLANLGKFTDIIADVMYLTRPGVFGKSDVYYAAAKLILPYNQIMAYCLFSKVGNLSGDLYKQAQAELTKLSSVKSNNEKIIEEFNKILELNVGVDNRKVDYQKIANTIDPVISSIMKPTGVTKSPLRANSMMRNEMMQELGMEPVAKKNRFA